MHVEEAWQHRVNRTGQVRVWRERQQCGEPGADAPSLGDQADTRPMTLRGAEFVSLAIMSYTLLILRHVAAAANPATLAAMAVVP